MPVEATIFGPMEMGLLLVVCLLLFGAKRIPEIASSFGKGIKEFKKSVNEVQNSIDTPPPPQSAPRQAAAPMQLEEESTVVREPKRLI